jgi:hypothetical protein
MKESPSRPTNDRAVSSTLNYVLSLAIASLLVTGLLIAGGTFVEDRQREVIRSELSVIGQQVASDINRADRLLTAGSGPTKVAINQSFPRRIAGAGYDIQLNPGDDELVLSSVDPEVRVDIHVETESTLVSSHADGGIVAVKSTSSDELEVTNG